MTGKRCVIDIMQLELNHATRGPGGVRADIEDVSASA